MRTALAIMFIAAACFGLEEKKPASKEGCIHYRYFNGFEEADDAPFTQWAKNSEVTVNFIGVTDEKSASGKKSFKIDITFNSGTYYYLSLPMNVACEGDIVFKCSVYIDSTSTANVIPGLDFLFPPTKDSGVYRCPETEKRNTWVPYRDEAVVPGAKKNSFSFFRKANIPGLNTDTGGKIIDRIGVMMTGGAPGKRVIVYIDDIELHGTVPDMNVYKALYESRIAVGKVESRDRAAKWKTEMSALQASIEPMNVMPGYGASYKTAVRAEVRSLTDSIDDMLSRDTVTYDIEPRIQFLRIASGDIEENLKRLGIKEASGMVVHVVDPAGQYPVLPDTRIIKGIISAQLPVTMCRNEYESASIVVTAIDDLAGLSVSLSDLTGPSGTYAASRADIKLVKCWYQVESDPATPIHARLRTAVMRPELLINDDALVRVDTITTNNYLRVGADYQLVSTRKFGALGRWAPAVEDYPVRDSAALKPVNVAKGKNQQFLVTFRPTDVPAGTYTGTIMLTAGEISKTMSVELTVLDFSLVKPENFTSSIYYVARLDPADKGTVSSELKNESQFVIDMSNMLAHGIDNPTVYEPIADPAVFERTLALRAKAGLDNSVIFSIGISTGAAGTEAGERSIMEKALAMKERASKYGCKTLYIYGVDEAVGDRVLKQVKMWEELNKAGIKVFVAGYPGGMPAVSHALNAFVCNMSTGSGIDRAEVALYHAKGNVVLSYADPQVGVEDPYIYRKNYGMMLAAYGIDGAMDYAYQHSFGNIWDDFDDNTYKDHVFAYPTADGVVNTLSFMGYREGMDDMRYIATLRKAIALSKAKGDPKADAAQAVLDGVLKTYNDSGNGDQRIMGRFGSGAYIDLAAERSALIAAIQSLNYR